MPAERMVEMRNSHRLFLQGILSRHILAAGEVKQLYRLSCERFGESASDDQLALFVVTINRKIAPIHMEIKKGVCEETGSKFYVLVNTQESSITKCSPDFTANELELFKKIVEKIVEDEGDVSMTVALNLCDDLDKKLSKEEGDKVIARMVRDKWFHKMNGRLSLHIRAILELDQYLKDQFPEQVVCCEMCKTVCLKGQCCNQCEVKLHNHCANHYFRNKATPTCPGRGCGAPWPQAGGRAATAATTATQQSEDAGEGTSQQQQPTTRKRRR